MERFLCDGCVTRRTFLASSGAAVFGLALEGCATASVYQVGSVGGKVLVKVADYPELAQAGGMIQLGIAGFSDPVVLVRQGDRAFVALSAVCTHLRCYVRPSRQFLVCPCHGSTFDLSGQVVRGPAEQALKRYAVAVSEGVVEVYLE